MYFDMNWLILIVAGLFEVVWATALKMSNGFRNPLADIICVAGMALSVWLLAVAMKTIPMGTAYAVWTGIGAIGGVAVGVPMTTAIPASPSALTTLCSHVKSY